MVFDLDCLPTINMEKEARWQEQEDEPSGHGRLRACASQKKWWATVLDTCQSTTAIATVHSCIVCVFCKKLDNSRWRHGLVVICNFSTVYKLTHVL